ncbi:thioether cross-link-forming SCIFF peptide maturase [Caproiciproducens galactitolivorans]|uniref:Cyclic pyranopterin monophosphate synthase n=1 Tax=Caproiciproducens galactitolivorans TaxID=642589 RepID=A0A4Z0YB94_9FIRM|nr:thioether cross-link-forming SCIFF peptide maturase [Caproiciproducens galactitolivorans]QEY34073.1 thioether cross-link-forming SCIFF peptide maturase [Caproiciproducens galactitolivorans]TGJ76511.1 cyclic pyranopterin monophosphate synthase [Caproiciproducens galactitolivorans]
MIHKYSLNGFNIVLDTNSGAVHLFDEVPFAMLDYLQDDVPDQAPQDMLDALCRKYDRKTVEEAYDELKELYRLGQLFSPDEYEKFAGMMKDAPLKSMCLNVAHDCNLRCEYCFAAKGDFGRGRMLMPFEVGKKAIDFLIEKSEGRHNLEVDFFGGEPLMNFEVVKQIVAYARGIEKEHNKNFRFTITTNGILLTDDKIDYINKEMSNCVLSIDGRKSVNDLLRVRADGSGSYDTIVPKFQKLVASRGDKDYYARGTFTKHNLDFTEDVLHMAELGFEQISIEPVVSDEKLDYSIKEEDLPRVFEEYERLSKVIIERKKAGKDFHFFHFMIDLNQGPCAVKRLRGCSCGNEYIAVTPEGDIFPCHQFVGDDSFKMGNVLDGTFDEAIKHTFALANIYSKPECKNCWAKFYCSGGCNANNQQYEGDIHKAHKISCELEKKRLECSIMIQAALAEA